MERGQIGWGQKVVTTPKRFKPELGVSHRMMILSEYSEHRTTHYVGGLTVLCLGEGCPACAAGIRATEKYGFNVLIYNVDADMNPLQNPPTYIITPWVTTKKVNESLQDMYQNCGEFTGYDIRAKCTDVNFGGAMEFLRLSQSLAHIVPGLAEQIIQDYQSKNREVGQYMGKIVSPAEMIELIAAPAPMSKEVAGTFSRPSRTVSPAQDSKLFGAGASQVSGLVGNVISNAFKQINAQTPQPTQVPQPAVAPKFPAPLDPTGAPSVLSVVDKEVVPATVEAAPSEAEAKARVTSLISKLKQASTK